MPDGKVYRRHRCQECKTKIQKKRRGAIRAWLVENKKSFHCNRCLIADHRVLVFHHKDPSKKEFEIGIRASGGMSKERILKEIKKCEVLCANCHQIDHYTEA
jgi:hypothetical protein